MNETPFFAKLSEITHVPTEQLSDVTAIKPGDWESIEVLDMLAAIDESYGTTVSAKSFNSCTTVGELRSLIRSALAG